MNSRLQYKDEVFTCSLSVGWHVLVSRSLLALLRDARVQPYAGDEVEISMGRLTTSLTSGGVVAVVPEEEVGPGEPLLRPMYNTLPIALEHMQPDAMRPWEAAALPPAPLLLEDGRVVTDISTLGERELLETQMRPAMAAQDDDWATTVVQLLVDAKICAYAVPSGLVWAPRRRRLLTHAHVVATGGGSQLAALHQFLAVPAIQHLLPLVPNVALPRVTHADYRALLYAAGRGIWNTITGAQSGKTEAVAAIYNLTYTYDAENTAVPLRVNVRDEVVLAAGLHSLAVLKYIQLTPLLQKYGIARYLFAQFERALMAHEGRAGLFIDFVHQPSLRVVNQRYGYVETRDRIRGGPLEDYYPIEIGPDVHVHMDLVWLSPLARLPEEYTQDIFDSFVQLQRAMLGPDGSGGTIVFAAAGVDVVVQCRLTAAGQWPSGTSPRDLTERGNEDEDGPVGVRVYIVGDDACPYVFYRELCFFMYGVSHIVLRPLVFLLVGIDPAFRVPLAMRRRGHPLEVKDMLRRGRDGDNVWYIPGRCAPLVPELPPPPETDERAAKRPRLEACAVCALSRAANAGVAWSHALGTALCTEGVCRETFVAEREED